MPGPCKRTHEKPRVRNCLQLPKQCRETKAPHTLYDVLNSPSHPRQLDTVVNRPVDGIGSGKSDNRTPQTMEKGR
jgi:hypothetical protein